MNETVNKNVTTEDVNKVSFFSKVWTLIVKFLKMFKEEFITYPLYIMAHPIKGYDDFKRENKGKLPVGASWKRKSDSRFVEFTLTACANGKFSFVLKQNHIIQNLLIE